MSQDNEFKPETEDQRRARLDGLFTSQIKAKQERIEKLKYDMLERVAELQARPEIGVGRVRGVVCEHGFVIVKNPAEPNFRKWQDTEKPTSADHLALVRPSLLPNKEGQNAAETLNEFERLCSLEPGIIAGTTNAVLELGGANAQDVLGKFKV